MLISSILLHIQSTPEVVAETQKVLRCHSALTVGETIGGKIPVVMEASSEEENRDLMDELRQIPGVSYIDVIFVHFEASDELTAKGFPSPYPPSQRERG